MEDATTSVQEVQETQETQEQSNVASKVEEKSFSQSDVDAMIKSRLERERKNFEKEKATWEKEKEESITEAIKLQKMNAEQKAQYEREKQEADFNKRLADLNARELKATAKETLASEGLPLELAEVLNYTDAETCKSSIEAVKTAFQSAVEKAVNEKLKGKSTPRSGQGGNQDTFNFGFTGVRPHK